MRNAFYTSLNFQYLKGSDTFNPSKNDSRLFFEKFIFWLSGDVGEVRNDLQLKVKHEAVERLYQRASAIYFFDMFDLVKSGASLFASKMRMSSEDVLASVKEDNELIVKMSKVAPPTRNER